MMKPSCTRARRVSRSMLAIVPLTFAPFTRASSQVQSEPNTLRAAVHQRVRVAMGSPRDWAVGRLDSLGNSTLFLWSGATTLELPLAQVRFADRSLGFSNRAEHAVFSGFAGAVIGFVIGARMPLSANTEQAAFDRFTYPTAGTLAGAAIGAAVGFIASTEQWQPMKLPRVTAAPER